ncbi:GTPase [Roseburia hominis]|uniref:TIGR03943 family putative permease subunit n=1 Tax=Roseburia hominis TaxID=301301 RepID=UPI00228548DE|nr:GTPase [Roseburia hominis]
MEETPVYLFTGFMDSGKTTLIQETLFDQEFGNGAKTLIIACEDGEVEYDEDKLKKINAKLFQIENEEDFTEDLLHNINLQYLPEQVFIEYNGTWEMAKLLEMNLPDGWVIVQSLATADATTYEMYLNNMRAMIMEQLFQADVVIFNRCDDNTPKGKFRRSVKALNRKAQIVYERADGKIDEGDNEELPFDINAPIIELSDADYGLWYLDATDNPNRYNGKKIKFLALVYNPEKMQKKGIFVPGRFAMTCCEADIQFVGFKCKYPNAKEIPHKSWITITAEVRVEFAKEYRGKGPVLYPISIEPAEKPEDELVYFS